MLEKLRIKNTSATPLTLYITSVNGKPLTLGAGNELYLYKNNGNVSTEDNEFGETIILNEMTFERTYKSWVNLQNFTYPPVDPRVYEDGNHEARFTAECNDSSDPDYSGGDFDACMIIKTEARNSKFQDRFGDLEFSYNYELNDTNWTVCDFDTFVDKMYEASQSFTISAGN